MEVELVAHRLARRGPQQRPNRGHHLEGIGLQSETVGDERLVLQSPTNREISDDVDTQLLQVGSGPIPERNRIAGLP